MALTPVLDVTIVFVILHGILSFIAFPVYFIFLRDNAIIKSRSTALEFYMWLFMLIFQLRLFQIIYSLEYPGEIPCSVLIWSGWLTPIAMLAVTMKCVRLILIFVVTSNKLKQMNEEGGEKRGLLEKFLVPKSFSNKNLSYMFLGACLFFGLFPLAITGYAHTHYGGMKEEVCHTIAFNIAAIVSFAILLILIALCVYQLIKVHDAYYVKTELKALGYICLFLGVPGYAITFVKNSRISIWGWYRHSLRKYLFYRVIDVIAVFLLCSVSFVAVSIVAYKNRDTDSNKSASEYSNTTEYSYKSSTSEADSFADGSKVKSKKMDKIMKDPHSLPFLESYLVHYQEVMLSNYLLLWNTLKQLTNIQEPLILVSKSFLAYGKFLGPNAYIFVDCVSSEQKDKLFNPVNAAMATESDIDPSLPSEIHAAIDELITLLEGNLEERLFKPFIKSKFYQEYLKASALNQDMIDSDV